MLLWLALVQMRFTSLLVILKTSLTLWKIILSTKRKYQEYLWKSPEILNSSEKSHLWWAARFLCKEQHAKRINSFGLMVEELLLFEAFCKFKWIWIKINKLGGWRRRRKAQGRHHSYRFARVLSGWLAGPASQVRRRGRRKQRESQLRRSSRRRRGLLDQTGREGLREGTGRTCPYS